jgi:hypothetical protein
VPTVSFQCESETPVTCGGQNLRCALFLNSMMYQLKQQTKNDLRNIEPANNFVNKKN